MAKKVKSNGSIFRIYADALRSDKAVFDYSGRIDLCTMTDLKRILVEATAELKYAKRRHS